MAPPHHINFTWVETALLDEHHVDLHRSAKQVVNRQRSSGEEYVDLNSQVE